MPVPETVYGLVLAGGRSTRMGSDKAALKAGGITQLERAVELLSRHLDRVFVSVSADQSDDPLRGRFEQIVDRYAGLGPIAGILSAMDSYPDKAWLVLACDLPNLDDETVQRLLESGTEEKSATAYQSVVDGLPEPLCAIWRPAARETIESYVEDKRYCPRKILINSPTELITQPMPGALHNVNTPADLAETDLERQV